MSKRLLSEDQKRARQIYPRARIVGDGPYRLLTTCRMQTIRLFQTKEEAAEATRDRDDFTCLGRWEEKWVFHADDTECPEDAVMPGRDDEPEQ